MTSQSSEERLRYLDADRVGCGGIWFHGFELQTATGDRLGELEGFVVDPEARRLRYLVFASGGRFLLRRYLLPLCPAWIDRAHHALRVAVERDALLACRAFNPAEVPVFSDEDVLAAIFHHSATPDEAPGITGG